MSASIPSLAQGGATNFAGSGAQGGRPNFSGAVPRGTTWFIGAIVLAGLLFVAGLWTEVFVLTGSEQRTAIEHGSTEASNLSAAFREDVSRELDRVAAEMNSVAAHMRADPAATDFHGWASQAPMLSGATVRAAILGPDGRLLSSTLESSAKPIDNSDREHFIIQRDGAYHGLFIGKPIVGRLSGQPSIPISLRVEAADGRFLGVVVFSLAPDQLTTLHRSIDLGSRGMMALFGTDGIVRARFISNSPDGADRRRPIGPRVARACRHGRIARLRPHLAKPARSRRPDLQRSPCRRLPAVRRRRPRPGRGAGPGIRARPGDRGHRRSRNAAAVCYADRSHRRGAAAEPGTRRNSRLSKPRWPANVALRKQVEQQLRDSEQKFQDVAEVSGDWIWETDAQHRFTSLAVKGLVDPARIGVSRSSAIGKTRWELAGANPEQDEKWRQHKADLEAHQPFRAFRYAVMGADGAPRHFIVSGKPVFDPSGNFLGHRGTATNETPMIEALERAEQAETLLRDAMDSISEGFVIYDHDDRLIMCNEAYRRLYPASAHLMVPGVKFETLVRNTLASGHYPDAAGREEEWVTNFLRTHNEAVDEIETQMRDGRWLLVSERRMRNGGLAGVRVDITEFKRIQVALSESERRLRDFAEMASDWFWEQDANLNFVWFSEGLRTLNTPSQSYTGRQRWEMNPDGATPAQWESHQADLAARRPFRDFRYRMRGADGSLRHVSIHGDPLFDNARFAGYRGIGRDITAQIEAEQELERAKERAEQAETLLRDAVDSISEGFVIFDREDRFVMCNEVYRQIYAEASETLVPGVSFEDFVRTTHARGGGNADWRGRETAWLEERLRHHREAKDAIEFRDANDAWFLVTDRRMKNGGIAGLRIDITALKRAQAALRESEERLDRAQAIAGIGSWELDVATGRYIWSKELYRIRGLSPQEFEPHLDTVASYIHPEDFPTARRWIDGLIAGHEQHTLDARMVRPDGEVRVLRVEGRAVADPDGTIRRVAGTMQDVTERRLIERQLAQAQKMEAIGNLTGGMAHDFNNVLAVIIGNLDLLKRLVKGDVAATELCDEALDGASRCTDLIRRLLAFARRQSLRPELTDMNALVGDIARLLGRILGEDIALNLHLDAGLRRVMADPSQLEAALVNLATNARDAMPKGGRLDITTSNAVLDASYAALHPDVAPGSYVRIEITDTGSGIAPDIIGRIFEPFFTTKEPGHGTGLGLAMAFGFVKQSGGHLSVYSEPGLGTTFQLYLPSTADVAMDDPSETEAVVGGDERVLVVEDNLQLRQATARHLVDLGYRVLEAEHATAALATLSSQHVDLLLTDVVMPGSMDGLDLAHHALSLRPGLKVVLTSGFPGVRGANRRMMDCPFPMLAKPSRRNELARMVRQTLDGGASPPKDPSLRRFTIAAGRLYHDGRADEGERV